MNPLRTELLKRAHEFGMIQNEVEVNLFLDWYERQPFHHIMEIGTHTGGFLYLLMMAGLPKQTVVSVDLPWQEHEYNVGHFRQVFADRVSFIVGNSHDSLTRELVLRKFARSPLDFLLLDGDHSEDGCRADFGIYKEFIRPGGWIGFHDINNGHGCGKFYWNEAINDRPHVEFGFGRTFGLGCVQML